MATNTRKLASLLGASGAGISDAGTLEEAAIRDGAVSATKVAADVATQAELDAIPEYDDNKVQTNLAILAFKAATNASGIKFDLQDQVIDEYGDASGIDTGASTNQVLSAGAYSGSSSVTPTVTEDADVGPTVDGDYTWYKWTDTGSTGSFSSDTSQDYEYLIVAGGGSGGRWHGSGGGAGGYRAGTDLSLVGGSTYTITVGAGAVQNTLGGTSGSAGTDGGDSSISGSDITDIESEGGGGGGFYGNPTGVAGRPGGSGGGGGSAATTAGDPGAALPVTSPVQGYAGGAGRVGNVSGAGGGGAGGAGQPALTTGDGDGGIGLENDIDGTNRAYAGGGGGTSWSGSGGAGTGGSGVGGAGGLAAADGGAGTANSGGGGGGSANDSGSDGGAGGSGVVILRRLTSITSFGDLTLQSTDTTAEAAPTKADMVMLIEDAGTGVGTVNTHIKGWISRYETGGTKTWTQGTLVDEGDWGTNKRILAFHDLTLTGTSGTQMAYKITTHSSSSVYNTKFHATSIGWK